MHQTNTSITILANVMADNIILMFKHAARCKDTREECSICIHTANYINGLPPQVSAIALQNSRPVGMRVPMSELMFDSGKDAWGSENDRHLGVFHATAALFAYHKKHFPDQYKNKKKLTPTTRKSPPVKH